MTRLAAAPLPVLIVGASGTGKELVARALHDGGSRSQELFVSENCAAIPESLFESVLFGHSRGSFTGAERDHPGLFLQAAGGTLFLDEVTELPLPLQSKLLRVLQERVLRPLGSTQIHPVRCRIVAATNRDPGQLIESGQLRADLYYRLAGAIIEIPPLRERLADIPLLAEHFLDRIASPSGVRLDLGRAALELLLAHDWPGNVREFAHEIERAAVLSESSLLQPEDFSPRLRPRTTGSVSLSEPGIHENDSSSVQSNRNRGERAMIEHALIGAQGNLSRAAIGIGWYRQKLYRRMQHLGIARGFGRPWGPGAAPTGRRA